MTDPCVPDNQNECGCGIKKTAHIRKHFRVKETIVTILADDPSFIEIAEGDIRERRREIESYIAADPFFAATLDPWPDDPAAPPIVRRMIAAGNAAGIGPMSAVAGAIAESAVFAMKRAGASFALVDNGGDIAVYNPARSENGPVTVGIYAGDGDDVAVSFKNLGLRFLPTPDDDIFGICTSSGTVGPSISFGVADAAVVISKNVPLADAAATALGNAFPKPGVDDADTKTKIEEALFAVRDFRIKDDAIDGALLIKGGNMGLFGNLPAFVRADVPWDIITKA